MKRGSIAAGAGGDCAPAAPMGRLWAAPQLHRYRGSAYACAHTSVWRETHTSVILLAVSPSFEWDPAKDAQNQRKHSVAFVEAQLAFLDPARVIAKDVSHSKGEPRFYCFGETGGGILTVRFTYRGDVIRIIAAGYWRRGKRIYEAQAKVPR